MKKNKTPKVNINPQTSKAPRTAPEKYPTSYKTPRIDLQKPPESVYSKKPAWRFGMMDMAGPWGCGNICAQNGIVRDILSKLQDFETMTWAGLEAKTGLKGKHNHLMPVDKICKEARDRLKKIKLDDLDELYSFRLSGMKRLWGKRENEIFYVIWWDPKHTVYPVPKKHT